MEGSHNLEMFLIDEPADLPESLKVGLKIYSFSAALRPLQPNGVNEPMYIRAWKVEGRLFLNKYKDLVFVTSDNKLMALIRGLERLMGGEVKSQVNEERLWLRTQSDCSITGEGSEETVLHSEDFPLTGVFNVSIKCDTIFKYDENVTGLVLRISWMEYLEKADQKMENPFNLKRRGYPSSPKPKRSRKRLNETLIL